MFYLAQDADGHDDPPGNSGPDESGDSSSGTFDPLPDSSDFSESPPPPGGPPRGPSPPSPVNRSRSPRRRGDHGVCHEGLLRLSDVVPPPIFDIDVHQVRLPHAPDDIQHLLLPPTWLLTNFPSLSIKPSTRRALGSMKHWSDLLGSVCGDRPPEVHLYPAPASHHC